MIAHMPQLIVRDIEEKVVRGLKERAGKHGVSMEEEHRRILREALFPKDKERLSFKDFLLSMPDVGEDSDFVRVRDAGRKIAL
jgi:antitoxin FitA